MTHRKENDSGFARIIEKMWRFFSSIKLTIGILLFLAAVCVIGTVIPQNQEPILYAQKYGATGASVIMATHVFDLYHSWWFQLILCLLTMNVFICSFDRLSVSWKTIFTKKPAYKKEAFEKIEHAHTITVAKSSAEVVARSQNYLHKYFGAVAVEEVGNETFLFAEKGRWSKMGAHIVHAGIILLLLGGLIGSVFGFDGYMMLEEGGYSDSVKIDNGKASIPLDFTVRCDSFAVEFHPSGMPKKYTSVLTLLQNNKEILTKAVEVNSPLRYRGVNFFQSTYGELPPSEAVISMKNKKTGETTSTILKKGEGFTLPDGKSIFTLMDFVPHLFSNDGTMRIDDVFVGYYQPEKGPMQQVLLPLKMPTFDEGRGSDIVFSIAGMKKGHYTGLQVTKDPGVGLVYTAFVFLLIGCFVVFFIPFKRVCFQVRSNGDTTDIRMVITSGKHKMALAQWNRQLEKQMASLLQN